MKLRDTLTIALLLMLHPALGISEVYSEDQFVRQVLEKSPVAAAAREQLEAAKLDEHLVDLQTATNLNLSGAAFNNRQPSETSAPSYSSSKGNSYDLNLTKQASTGTAIKLGVEATQSTLYDFTPAIGAPATDTDVTRISPKVEVSQSLWQNGFGRSIRLQRDSLGAASGIQDAQVRAQMQMITFEARSAYARLAFARDALVSARQTLTTAERILEYVQGKKKSNLLEQADFLQSQALVASRRLAVRAAETEEYAAALAFNALRGIEGEAVGESLITLKEYSPGAASPTAKIEARSELKVMKMQLTASEIEINKEVDKGRPALDAFASYGLLATDETFGDASGNLGSPYQPALTVGLRLSMTLDRDLVSKGAQAAALRKSSLEKKYQDSARSYTRDLDTLLRKRNDALDMLAIAKNLEEIQQAKLKNEQIEFRNGRSTTYQILMFAQDLANAELSRLKAVYDILLIDIQLGLFQEERV